MEVKAPPSFIAVVDDDPAVCKAFARLLRSAGMDVTTFGSGDAFVASLINGRKPDCVVLDLHMPGMNGFDVQSHLASISEQRLPLVVVTAHDAPAVQQRVMAAGASAYLRKPVDARQLLDAIRTAIP